MRPSSRNAACAIALLLTIGVGCGDEPAGPEVGSIIINTEPDILDAPWRLSGPNDYSRSGAGDTTLFELPPGTYAVSWGAVVAPWLMPNPATVEQTLAPNAKLMYTGQYVLPAPWISIDVQPNGIMAPWQISGPGGFSEVGSGDRVIGEVAAGVYTLTWGSVPGWIKPSAESISLTLNLGGWILFPGRYTPGLVPIGGGEFAMGSPELEDERRSDEILHQVVLAHNFVCQVSEVTNYQYMTSAQWAYDNGYATVTSAVLLDNCDGSTIPLLRLGGDCEVRFTDGVFRVNAGMEDHPILGVNWYGAAAYCDWQSLQMRLPRAYSHDTWQCNNGSPYSATGFRLPTEAEWEYACRATTSTPFSTGDCLNSINQANYDGLYPYTGCIAGPRVGRAAAVASYAASAWGLYDMHGNVWEWCNDWYGPYDDLVNDPVEPTIGPERVLRGGTWRWPANVCRSARRGSAPPDYSSDDIGFRVVQSVN